MSTATNSPLRKVVGVRALYRYRLIDDLVATIEQEIDACGGLGTGPPQYWSAEWLGVVTAAIARHSAESQVEANELHGVWFLALSYLEIRGKRMLWAQVSPDDRCYVIQFFDTEAVCHNDRCLGVREHMLLALRDRNMCPPRSLELFFATPS